MISNIYNKIYNFLTQKKQILLLLLKNIYLSIKTVYLTNKKIIWILHFIYIIIWITLDLSLTTEEEEKWEVDLNQHLTEEEWAFFQRHLPDDWLPASRRQPIALSNNNQVTNLSEIIHNNPEIIQPYSDTIQNNLETSLPNIVIESTPNSHESIITYNDENNINNTISETTNLPVNNNEILPVNNNEILPANNSEILPVNNNEILPDNNWTHFFFENQNAILISSIVIIICGICFLAYKKQQKNKKDISTSENNVNTNSDSDSDSDDD